MSFITRFVSSSEKKVEIKKKFFGFVKTSDSTGQVLYGITAKMLEMRNITVANMRGQGLDNGGNEEGEIMAFKVCF